jgi:twitching motility protein PilT
MARIDSFLRLAAEQRASDLHFHAGTVPIIRHHGELMPIPFRVLSEDEARRCLLEILGPEQRAALERDGEIDFAYELPEGRFRAHVFHQVNGLSAVFRAISRTSPTLAELELPPAIAALTREANGLVLVTGPTGSGKSTTLAAMVEEINRSSPRHIITIEEPIEHMHTHGQSVITQRQVGLHVDTFAGALRSALREAPDVLVVGELRDPETIMLALSACETGILVLATMHTRSAVRAVDRILDAVPEDAREQARSVLSVLLKGVVAQRLCKRAGGEGQVAAIEILLYNYAIGNMIRESKLHQLESYLASGKVSGTGMQTLDDSLIELVAQGTVLADEALRVGGGREELRRALAAFPAEH